MSKLNPNAQKWVDALRSGKYKQGRSALRLRDEYCCLGVGCEVAIECGLAITVTHDGPYYKYDGGGIAMSDGVCGFYGLNGDKAQNTLMKLNDSDEAPFPQIADYIEAHAEELGLSA